MASIAAVVAMVDRPDELGPVLQQLGSNHLAYGVAPHHYDYVCASMLSSLAETFRDDWTAELAETWAYALRHVSDLMIAAQVKATV
ncbi:MAG: globin domain-containing protein [Planctomycetota bacterium]|jgi:hemoglobin-like flavoprotein